MPGRSDRTWVQPTQLDVGEVSSSHDYSQCLVTNRFSQVLATCQPELKRGVSSLVPG